MPAARRLPEVLLAATVVALIVSGIRPRDYPTWILEVAPILVVVPILVATRRRAPLTPLLYVLVFVHALVLMMGAHYTYAEVPIGFRVQEAFGLARNHYDRLGHLAQGFIPAIAAREVFLRWTSMRRDAWLYFHVTAACLAFSALYEMLEWWTALVAEGGATAFLGTQGDPWDTQWDMFLCLVGALAAQALLARMHDRQLARLGVAA